MKCVKYGIEFEGNVYQNCNDSNHKEVSDEVTYLK